MMKLLRSTWQGAFSSVCTEVAYLQSQIGWRMERFDKHQDINGVHGSVQGPTSVSENRVQSRIKCSRNLVKIWQEIYIDVIEFADLHPQRCVQQHVTALVHLFLHLFYFSSNASEGRKRVFCQRLYLGILLPLRLEQGYHSGKAAGQDEVYTDDKMQAYSRCCGKFKPNGVSPLP